MRARMRRAGLMASVAAFLWLGGCGGGGDGEDGPPSSAMLEGDQAVQAVGGVIRSTLTAIIALRTEDSPLAAAGAACNGGSVDASCAVENRQSIVRGAFEQCRLALAGGNVLTADGGLRIQTNDVGTCITGMIGPTATLELDFDDFSQVLTDANGNELLRSRTNGTDRIVPSGVGCAGRNVMEHVDATIDGVTNARFPGRLIAEGADLSMRLRDLQLNQTSEGSVCERSVSADGHMDVDDRANGLRFAQRLSGVAVSFVEANDAALVQIDGHLANDCVGDVAVATLEPIEMHSATDCPTAGRVRVTVAGRISELRFSSDGGLSIDYEADGQFELTASSCRAPTIAECVG